jgi:hypothetical protein
MPVSRPALVQAVFVVLVGAIGLYGTFQCRGSGVPREAVRDFGDIAGAPPDASAYLALARAIVDRRGRAAVPEPARAPGRRIFLGLWRGGQLEVASANGPTLADAVSSAAESIAAGGATLNQGAGRLELDVPTRLQGAALDEDTEDPLASIGLEGVLVTRDDGRTGFVLPGEIVERGYFRGRKLDYAAIRRVLAARAHVSEPELATMRAYRFQADGYVDASNRAAPPVHIRRGMVEPPAEVAPDSLLTAVRSGADYLVRILSASGRYVYMYHPVDDRDDPSYGWLRHSGTTYALFEAYEEFGTPSYLDQGERALHYLAINLSRDAASQGRYVVDTDDEEQQKVGGAALALLAFTKHAAVVGKRDDPEGVPQARAKREIGRNEDELEIMRALARFILKAQYEDGHFRSNGDLEGETGKKLKRDAIYYPGEATLALMRLYTLDPQPSYLDAARRAADFIVQVRDAYVSEDNQEHDHWISYAFNELYRVTRNEAYLNHAYKIARAIQRKQRRASNAPAPDWVGTFYEGQTTPASTRVEAYDADILLSRFAGRPDAWLLDPAKEAARSILGQQFSPDNDYWLKNPAKAEGGVRESLFVHDVRIDYVQHAMSAWLHLARILRDPNYGKSGANLAGR